MAEFAGSLNKWHDATDLYDTLRKSLQPHERGRHLVTSAARELQSDGKKDQKEEGEDWHELEKADAQDTYDEVEAEFVTEDRLRRLRAAANTRCDTELDGYYKRKYGDGAASSSADGSKRKASGLTSSMEVDAEGGEVSGVDFDADELFEC